MTEQVCEAIDRDPDHHREAVDYTACGCIVMCLTCRLEHQRWCMACRNVLDKWPAPGAISAIASLVALGTVHIAALSVGLVQLVSVSTRRRAK